MKKLNVVLLLITFVSLLSGCATMNDLMASLEGRPAEPSLKNIKSAPRYSDTQNLGIPTDRQYKRMTRNRMEEESDLGANAGSMWVMDGQGAYLFAQNKMRKEGDLLNVKLEAAAMKQVETKVGVIKKLLKQLDDQQAALNNSLAGVGRDTTRNPASAEGGATPVEPQAATTTAAATEAPEKEEAPNVENIPTRLVEKLADGNYRVKGQQPFMIGKREYKVIVTGLIRPEDFNDQGISSDRLLDPQYDVVSIRKSRNE